MAGKGMRVMLAGPLQRNCAASLTAPVGLKCLRLTPLAAIGLVKEVRLLSPLGRPHWYGGGESVTWLVVPGV